MGKCSLGYYVSTAPGSQGITVNLISQGESGQEWTRFPAIVLHPWILTLQGRGKMDGKQWFHSGCISLIYVNLNKSPGKNGRQNFVFLLLFSFFMDSCVSLVYLRNHWSIIVPCSPFSGSKWWNQLCAHQSEHFFHGCFVSFPWAFSMNCLRTSFSSSKKSILKFTNKMVFFICLKPGKKFNKINCRQLLFWLKNFLLSS